MNQEELEELAWDILDQIYEEATPGMDFRDALENPENYPDEWYDQHYLDKERQKEIMREHCEDHDLTDQEHTNLTMTVILHYGPRSIKPDEIPRFEDQELEKRNAD